ncbi:MAG TPA: hypothetical protein VFY93_11310 [Planctomycetota bacterium]|nr:hypothetical protein [Planctomycetota bacterium]
MVLLLLALLLLPGPEGTLAGKFPGHAPEYLERYPQDPVALPDPLPMDVDALCGLVQAGHGTAAVYEALGDALLARGDGALAYRAYRKAHALADTEGKPRLIAKKDRCAFVPEAVIEEEERRAAVWVAWLKEYERARIRAGKDPRELGPFYERYGRAEDDLAAVAQARRVQWAMAMAAGLLGAAAILGFVLRRRRRA